MDIKQGDLIRLEIKITLAAFLQDFIIQRQMATNLSVLNLDIATQQARQICLLEISQATQIPQQATIISSATGLDLVTPLAAEITLKATRQDTIITVTTTILVDGVLALTM